MKNVKAIILAAGRGSRMGKLTEDRPKCLVEISGSKLLDLQIAAIKSAGIEEIGIVTGYKNEALKDWHLKTFHNPRWASTNMVSSLACASEWLEKFPCIVSYSDIFYHPSAVSSLLNSTSSLAITYDVNWQLLWQKRFNDPLDDAETFRVNSSTGKLLEIGKKPQSISQIQGQYMGLLYITPAAWKAMTTILQTLTTGQYDSLYMTDLLQRVIEQTSAEVDTVPYQERWGEVDSEADLLAYRDL